MALKYPRLALFGLTIAALVFIRTIGIKDTARFTQDESSDLLRMEQFWSQKKISLIGPISTDNTKVFGSLTYYMLLPFAAAGTFTPWSPVYGTICWGTITALLLIGITLRERRTWLPFSVILSLCWYPLLEASRWAWNPHLTIFWIALGLWYQRRSTTLLGYLLTGLCFGLSVHHHYIALIATFSYLICLSIQYRKKAYRLLVGLWVGYFLALLPFLVFDMLHPPGLFIGQYLLSGKMPHISPQQSLPLVGERLRQAVYVAGYTLARLPLAAWSMVGFTASLLYTDLRKAKSLFLAASPFLMQIIPGAIMTNYEVRYFLPALPFYWWWLIQTRSSTMAKASQLMLILTLMVSSFITVYPQITQPLTQPSMRVINAATDWIAFLYRTQDLHNLNITTVASPDSDLMAMKYRDVLALKKVALKAPSEYDATEHLFVISTAERDIVRNDASIPLRIFKNGKERGVQLLSDGPWKVYWLSW